LQRVLCTGSCGSFSLNIWASPPFLHGHELAGLTTPRLPFCCVYLPISPCLFALFPQSRSISLPPPPLSRKLLFSTTQSSCHSSCMTHHQGRVAQPVRPPFLSSSAPPFDGTYYFKPFFRLPLSSFLSPFGKGLVPLWPPPCWTAGPQSPPPLPGCIPLLPSVWFFRNYTKSAPGCVAMNFFSKLKPTALYTHLSRTHVLRGFPHFSPSKFSSSLPHRVPSNNYLVTVRGCAFVVPGNYGHFRAPLPGYTFPFSLDLFFFGASLPFLDL